MKKIIYVEMTDGKRIYNPSDDELKLLSEGIKSMLLHELLTAEEAKAYFAELAQSVGIVDMSIRGSCGMLHPSFKHWQDCEHCRTIDEANTIRNLT